MAPITNRVFARSGPLVAEVADICVVRLQKEGSAEQDERNGSNASHRLKAAAAERGQATADAPKQVGGIKITPNVAMKFVGDWQSNIDGISRNVVLDNVVVDSNGIITGGTFWSDGETHLNCSFMAIAIDGTFRNNVLNFTHDNGCGETTTSVAFDGKSGVGEWQQGQLKGTIRLTQN